jgi:hypothetical protein
MSRFRMRNPTHLRPGLWGCLAVFGALVVGCSDRGGDVAASAEKRGAPPPPTAGAGPVGCTRASIDDPIAKPFFPAKVAGFCLDPQEGGRAMGKDSKEPLEKMCDLFDGECAVYEGFGVERVVQARYVAEAGSSTTLDVVLSRFDSPASAFAMYTKRTVGDGDPADSAAPKPIAVRGAAALGVGNAYLWRGNHLVEMTYADTKATPAEVEAASAKVLPELARLVSEALPGDAAMLPTVLALPQDSRLPVGVRYAPKEAMRGAKDAGGGAIGYYDANGKRWRVVAFAHKDEAEAKAAMAAIAKLAGAKPLSDLGEEAFSVELTDSGNAVEWLVARKAGVVRAVGDEARALRAGASADERSKISLPVAEKKARLEKLLAAP